MSQQSPQWLSISPLPLLAKMIDGMLENAQENHLNLKAASHRPHLLDDYTINRMIRTYTEQQQDLTLYEEQLSYWRDEELDIDQRYEVKRLTSQVGRLHKTLSATLSLAGELKAGTIELTLGQDDADLAFDLLVGKRKL
jgi:hypothetical protein